MATTTDGHRYPAGTGWLAGSALGLAVGTAVWFVSGDVVLGLILYVATATPLGATLERALDTEPLTPSERQWAMRLVFVGLLVGLLVFVLVVLLD